MIWKWPRAGACLLLDRHGESDNGTMQQGGHGGDDWQRRRDKRREQHACALLPQQLHAQEQHIASAAKRRQLLPPQARVDESSYYSMHGVAVAVLQHAGAILQVNARG